jgi:hypothetical protein
MQDRTSANSMKVLLQRTAGPYMWVIRDRSLQSQRSIHVRFAPKADKRGDTSLSPLSAISGPEQTQQHAVRGRQSYSITSSAATSSLSGTLRPSTLAVVRLMTRSNLVGCSTGMSAGLAGAWN